MSDDRAESPQQDAENDIAGKKAPKKTSLKRKSKLEREREESEEIIKSMGGAVEEGRRRTRSSARGAVTKTPATPAAKKPKVTRGRGKPKKIDVDEESNDIDEGAEESKPSENDDKKESKDSVQSMEVDEKTDDAQSNDIPDKVQNDEGKEKESDVEQTEEVNRESVPAVANSQADDSAKSPVEEETAPKADAIETPKVETPPSPAKDSPVTRPIEEADIPDAATEPVEVNEKASELSHANNESVDAVIKENKTEEKIDEAPSNAEPTIKPNESAQEVAAALIFKHTNQ
ncbi:hypothetical protein Bhyg_14064 [Pseudolycoriella hygida]|uniref:Uncharacterized protein n=1 Tax=Pseudolycoriella hygida TaxID=35572 RepID=A0A9Q0MP55_9DIPT|nr:hypothetical protein Bhyg_14064 [Pseudolycoriella hygida]